MPVRLFFSCTVLLLACSFAESAETYFEVLDLEGQAVLGTLVQLDSGQITVNVQGELQTLPIASVVKIRNLIPNPYRETSSAAAQQHRQPPPSRSRLTNAANAQQQTNAQRLINQLAKIQQASEQAVQKSFPDTVITLELTDGSRLTAADFSIADGQADVRLLELQNSGLPNAFSLPLEALSAVRFSVRGLSDVVNPSADWLRLAVPSAEGDKLIVGNPGTFDVYTGILGDVNAETVFFNVDGTVLPIPRHRIYGLVLHGEVPPTTSPPLATLTHWSGTQGMVSDIRLDGEELTWRTASGLTVSIPLDEVSEIDFGEKGIASLFDFERVHSEFALPFASELGQEHGGLLRTFVESRTRVSREIVLDGNVYERGVTLQGSATLEYHLPRPFVSLRAVIGIEDQFRPWSSSVLKILADSQVLGTWKLRGDAASQRIEVHLPQNCRTITFVVEPLLRPGTSTILTIADPKVVE
ncbi:MAG: NPCBM/NEW2 domain-containing protein [Planctomycetaceae bacterium]|nr:NPCBM/NEW2 domain-containing protein [Planctomycetaceae bacterium]